VLARWLIRVAVTVWIIAALIAFAGAVNFANGVSSREVELRVELRQLQREHRQLQREHRDLQFWVVDVLRPWLQRAVIDGTPEEVPPPPAGTVPTPVPVPTPSPSAIPTPEPSPPPPSPSPPSPSPSASPSLICVPIIQNCI